jgi:NAD-dependent dihydropyrimidine dehydrogenase PreA subunit
VLPASSGCPLRQGDATIRRITQRGVLDLGLERTRLEERVTRMPYVICEPCVGVKDKACVEICPVDCIYEGTKEGFPDMLFIHPDECIDCGVCQPECPVSAIYPEDDVPEEWTSYIQTNRDFFA